MITSLVVNGLNLNNPPSYVLTGIKGVELPPVRLASFDIAGAHFGRHVSAFYGTRRFGLDGVIVGTTVSDFIDKRDALYAALDVFDGEKTFTFTLANGRILTLSAVLAAPLDFSPRAGWPNAAEYHAELEAAFPFFQAETGSTQSTGLATGGGGTVPATVPMTLTQGSGGALFFTNAGNAFFWPTARITGALTNPTIRNHATGQELRLALTLASGEYIDVDFRNKTVVDNTGRNRYDAVTGDWWYFSPATTTEVRFLGDSGSGSLAMTVYDTFLAI